MEKINNNDNFFREAFDNFERKPSDRVWNNIEKGIKPNFVKNSPFFKSPKFIVSGIIIAIIVTVVFFVLQNKNNQIIINTSPETVVKNIAIEDSKPVEMEHNKVSAVKETIQPKNIQNQNNTNTDNIKTPEIDKISESKPISNQQPDITENIQIAKSEKNSSSNTPTNLIKANLTTETNIQPVNNVYQKKNNISEISFSPDQNICKGDKIKLFANGGKSYLWSTGERTPEIYVNPILSTDYSIIVTDENGNQKSGMISVTVSNCESIFIPNAFTPNGDGYQDVFKAIGDNIKNFEMIIVSRAGQIVFTSKDINEGWNGNYKGNPVQMGTYVYNVKYIDELNKPHNISGHVSVIR